MFFYVYFLYEIKINMIMLVVDDMKNKKEVVLENNVIP
jgi:hypothetical protein